MSSTTVKTSLLHHIRDNNSEETSKKAIKLLLQVVANIVKFPHEEKYRKLKEDKILPKIDNCHQFFDIIYRIGFIQLSTHIELPMTASLDPLADLVGEIEGKPAPQVPKMDSKKSGGCCETDSGQTGCCGGTKSSDKKKSGGCCGGDNKNNNNNNETKKSGGCCDTDTHNHNHTHNDNHNHNHNHKKENGSCGTETECNHHHGNTAQKNFTSKYG